MDEVEQRLASHLPRLRRFAYGLARSTADADDLTQASAERILKSRDRWQAGTNFEAWAYRVMRNLWIDTTRSRVRTDGPLLPEEEGFAVGMAGDAEGQVERAFLMRAMGRLPDEQREACALVLVEGLAYREAAEVLDIPMGTLTSRLVRGRQALMAMLEE